VTRMLPRDRAELIVAEYAAGKPVRLIAETYGHSITTIRDYAHGRRTPGEPAARADDFAPFASYCRQRLADDPHLRTPALLAELSRLGRGSSRATLYRSLERYGIQTHPCPGCHPASMSGYSPPDAVRNPQPSPLPVPAAPVAGETLASFLGRLAAANRTSPDALLDILPPWFRVKARWHDDRWQPGQLTPGTDDAASQLAAISGTTVPAIRNALPAFGARSGQPARALTACRRCTAARRIQQPVPVHLPAHHQICLRHGIWLPGAGMPQFSVGACPDIVRAERQARRLLRHCAIEQLIYAKVQVAHAPGDQGRPARSEHLAWKRRMGVLIESNSRAVIEACPQPLFLAAGYPEIVASATTAARPARSAFPRASVLKTR
jgi:TniQ